MQNLKVNLLVLETLVDLSWSKRKKGTDNINIHLLEQQQYLDLLKLALLVGEQHLVKKIKKIKQLQDV